ncbi:MAG TPA: type II toxin-antitoxin system RelE/ParE family toxin [Sphingomicrobium sp.]|nr:type II toxin-antitoxin system RelE/ParE family toxin [Sphingomicrobium sp.]
MQTVIQPKSFLAAAKATGMSAEEREALVDYVAANPTAGDLIQGTGGCRKLRHRRPGTGKSGGYRVITFFDGEDIPVALLTVFGKNERDNLTKTERNALATATAQMAAELRNLGK